MGHKAINMLLLWSKILDTRGHKHVASSAARPSVPTTSSCKDALNVFACELVRHCKQDLAGAGV